MTRARREDLALRRQALATRAALQRVQIRSALTQVRSSAARPKTIAGLALRLAGSWAGRPAGQASTAPGVSPQPWMLSAGWLLARALRASPAARWLVGAGAAGVAIWWVVRALRTPEGDDETG